MKEFKKVDKIFIKSSNTTNKIYNRYLYSLIPFVLFTIIYNLIGDKQDIAINIIKSLLINISTCILVQYIFNLIKKDKNIIKIFKEDNIITIGIILSLFSINSNIYTMIISSIISILAKNLIKSTNTSASLYGILLIILSSYYNNAINTPLTNLKDLSYIGSYNNIIKPYGTILDYIIGTNNIYLSPLLSLLAFIYLFHKKSIKYNIIFSYIITLSSIMLLFGLLNNMNIWYSFFQMTTGNLLFLSVFCLTDYPNTPATGEGQIIYGIILAILTGILRFIIPELSTIIALIIGPLLLTKLINKISFKLKYNKKTYYTTIIILTIISIITTFMLNIII